MTAQELAAKLNGHEYRNEITKEEQAEAKAAGLVVVFGAGDDLMEFRGAIYDEADCFEGGEVLVDGCGPLPDYHSISDEGGHEDYFSRKPNAKKIEALWCREGGYDWTYKTDIPHATFDVIEDGVPRCRGIVFARADVEA